MVDASKTRVPGRKITSPQSHTTRPDRENAKPGRGYMGPTAWPGKPEYKKPLLMMVGRSEPTLDMSRSIRNPIDSGTARSAQ